MISLLFGALLVEVAVRVRQWLRYGTTSPEVFEGVEDPATGLVLPVAGMSNRRLRINRLGFRGPEIEMPKPAGRLRLAFLGGSTTFCAEVSHPEGDWPSRVTRALAEAHPEVAFDCVNGGVPRFCVEESLKNLRHRVSPLKPDVIVIYHATNDLTRDTRALARSEGLTDDEDYETSFMADVSVAWSLIEKNLRARELRSKAADGEEKLHYDAAKLAAAFEQRLLALVEEARKVAPVVALVTFCHRLRSSQSEEAQREAATTSLYYMPYMTLGGLLEGFHAYNDAVRRVAAKTGAILVEAAECVPADDLHFNDSVHLKDEGCVVLARKVAAGLEAAPAFQSLLQAHPARERPR